MEAEPMYEWKEGRQAVFPTTHVLTSHIELLEHGDILERIASTDVVEYVFLATRSAQVRMLTMSFAGQNGLYCVTSLSTSLARYRVHA